MDKSNGGVELCDFSLIVKDYGEEDSDCEDFGYETEGFGVVES